MLKKIKCRYCRKIKEVSGKRRLFCSTECYLKDNYINNKRAELRKCKRCGKICWGRVCMDCWCYKKGGPVSKWRRAWRKKNEIKR